MAAAKDDIAISFQDNSTALLVDQMHQVLDDIYNTWRTHDLRRVKFIHRF